MIEIKKNLSTVVIFGRANVGKSTLFNRLTEKNQAMVSGLEGTTRDRNIGLVEWRRVKFKLIDTGGIVDIGYLAGRRQATGEIEAKVQSQARSLLARADLILFLVDARTGLLPADRELAKTIKKTLPSDKPVILAANKADSPKLRLKTAEFYKLALGEPIPVSAINGSGSGDLLDLIIAKIKPKAPELKLEKDKNSKDNIKVCIIGKPNTGKSSLINAILKLNAPESGAGERLIVSPAPHTTREPRDTEISRGDIIITLVDTAGISKTGMRKIKIKKTETLERLGIEKSLKALARAQIALLVFDINEELTRQDSKITEEIIKRKKSLIIVANKWDLIKNKNTKTCSDYIYSRLPFAAWAPVYFLSALTGAKVKGLFEPILSVYEQRRKMIGQGELNTFLKKIIKQHRPTKGRTAKLPRIYEITQTKANPPEFTVRIGKKDSLHESYVRFIENRLRDKFGFLGTPISIYIKKGRNSTGL